MGTGRDRTQESPESPHSRLLRAADLFYLEGINLVGINKVLAAANTPIMSLYRNFGSKEGLVAEFLKLKGMQVRAMFQQEAEARADTARDRILAVFDVLGEVVADEERFRGCALINACVETPDFEHPFRAIALEHKNLTRDLFARHATEMGARDPERLAVRLTMLMDGAFVTAELRRGDPSVAQHARAAAEALLVAADQDAVTETHTEPQPLSPASGSPATSS